MQLLLREPVGGYGGGGESGAKECWRMHFSVQSLTILNNSINKLLIISYKNYQNNDIF